MRELTKRQRQTLDRLEERIAAASDEWVGAYCQAGGDGGNAVVSPDSELAALRDNLVALRTKRNNLLDQYRDEGRNI